MPPLTVRVLLRRLIAVDVRHPSDTTPLGPDVPLPLPLLDVIPQTFGVAQASIELFEEVTGHAVIDPVGHLSRSNCQRCAGNPVAAKPRTAIPKASLPVERARYGRNSAAPLWP